MNKTDAEQLFQEYKTLKAQQSFYQARISELTLQMKAEKARMADDLVRPVHALTGMPRSGQLSDPTAEAGTTLADGYQSAQLKKLQAELQKIRETQAMERVKIDQAEALLSILKRKERFLVEAKLVRRLSWKEIAQEYEQKYGHPLGTSGLRKAYLKALDILPECAA